MSLVWIQLVDIFFNATELSSAVSTNSTAFTGWLLIFYVWAKCGPQRRWSCPHPQLQREWIWMKYEIWWEFESLIKGRQPVTCGNVFLQISGCPGFSFQLLCYWWLSVPDLSGWSPSNSDKWTRILYPHIHMFKVTVPLLLVCLGFFF